MELALNDFMFLDMNFSRQGDTGSSNYFFNT